MKNKRIRMQAVVGVGMVNMLIGTVPLTVLAEEAVGEWKVENGNYYWYENGVKQGTEGRGKEIYDPGSDAWYWLDAVDGGKMATSKDLYQESVAGEWAEDKENGTGKWVRYDENGHMVKGWYENENGKYYFDYIYGTMAKGTVTIDGKYYTFDAATGILISENENINDTSIDGSTNGWVTVGGVEYWYENGVRQGMEGRGKEIYDPTSDAWYWLDAVDGGKKATSKDVYQESAAGQWADREDGTGKWVRYDENGHMIKGWSEKDGNRYYFDPTYGAMVKGEATIDGIVYHFDVNTGICQGEVVEDNKDADTDSDCIWQLEKTTEYDANGNIKNILIYDSLGRVTEKLNMQNTAVYCSRICYYYVGDSEVLSKTIGYSKKTESAEWAVGSTFVYTYNENGEPLNSKTYFGPEDTAYLASETEYKYDEQNRVVEELTYSYMNDIQKLTRKLISTYDTSGKKTTYDYTIETDEVNAVYTYTYNENGDVKENTIVRYNTASEVTDHYRYVYEYDANGNCTKKTNYNDKLGTVNGYEEYVYEDVLGNGQNIMVANYHCTNNGTRLSGTEYNYENGKIKEYYSYNENWHERTVYDISDFPCGEDGTICEKTDYLYTKTYSGNEKCVGKCVNEYKCFVLEE